MASLLFKTEPSEFAFDDLLRSGTSVWDGVTNPQACAVLRRARKGDRVYIYHTGNEKAIVGTATIAGAPRPDPKRPELTARGDVKFPVVDVKAGKRLATRVPLAKIKADARFKGFALVTNSRLSVMDVPEAIDEAIQALAKG
jgi:predicted RNA-binding protein with PUA-like domain